MTVAISPVSGRPGRIFFYVQHLLGIGHLVRASRIATAMSKAGMDVTMVTGGSIIEGFPGEGVRHVQLPVIVSSNSSFSGLANAQGNPVDEAFQKQRIEHLLAAFDEADPDAVIIEAFPFGRRQMRFELLPLLAAIKARARKPLLYSSVRDILQENRKPGRDEETASLIEEHFAGVLVHGDSNFVRLEDTFPRADRIASKVFYTGLVAPDPPDPSTEQFDVIVSAGGGAVGAELIRASLEARAHLADERRWCIITGPNLPQVTFEAIARDAPPTVSLFRFRKDFPSLLMLAELSISQAGYNTVCDLLRAPCASILIPFASGGETEQTVRAQKLEALGFAQVVKEADLSGAGLARAIKDSEAEGQRPAMSLELDGASNTARYLLEAIASRL